MAGNIPYHPAPGSIGELMPGYFSVPQDPITMARQGITRKPGISEILPGYYVVPQNPIIDRVAGNVKPLGVGGCGCGCGGHSSCAGGGMLNGQKIGMGDWTSLQSELGTGNFSGAFGDSIAGIPVTTLLMGAAALYLFMTVGGSQSHVSRGRRAYRAYAS